MNSFVEFLQANPLYIVVAVALIIFLIISLIKKAVKLAVIAALLFFAYSYYLNDSFSSYESLEGKAKQAVEMAKEALEN